METTVKKTGALSKFLDRHFPPPHVLFPASVGIDISDASVKWLRLSQESRGGIRVHSFGSEMLKEGAVMRGIIRNPAFLTEALAIVRKKAGTAYAHAALPEEIAFVFPMHVPVKTDRVQARKLVEFELEGRVPIPAAEAVFDFTIVDDHDELGEEIGVELFKADHVQAYIDVFLAAGLVPMSFEVEAHSVARAVTSRTDPVTLIVDCGYARTGFAVVKYGVPIFTSTADTGGANFQSALKERGGVPDDQALAYMKEFGLVSSGTNAAAALSIQPVANAIKDEILRHFQYWDSQRNNKGERSTPVERVVLVGGTANLRGFADLVSGAVHREAEIGNIWRNLFSFNEYIPPIARQESVQYATALGLAMRSVTP